MTQLVKIAEWKDLHLATVVFVHGLGGNVYTTWQSSLDMKSFWPKWLAEDISGITVYSLSYAAPVSNWLGTAMSLENRALNVTQCLLNEPDLSAKPVIFICHSLGGLLVKQILRDIQDHGLKNPKLNDLGKNINRIVFIASPHFGSGKASLLDRFRFILWPSSATMSLLAFDPGLINLNNWYRSSKICARLKHLVFLETKGTLAGTIVNETSADPGIDGVRVIPIDGDHVSICKPTSRDDLLYKSVLQFVGELCHTRAKVKGLSMSTLLPISEQQPLNFIPKLIRLLLLLVLIFAMFIPLRSKPWSNETGWIKGSTQDKACGEMLLQHERNYPFRTTTLVWKGEDHTRGSGIFKEDRYNYKCRFEDRISIVSIVRGILKW